ncbi:MAG: hypothetical protein PF482_06670 [Desulfobacteraceae bacterium]|nr:hypothetical protein [Desulfobacteraceae bacterium]
MKQLKKANPSVPSEHGQRVVRVTREDMELDDVLKPGYTGYKGVM